MSLTRTPAAAAFAAASLIACVAGAQTFPEAGAASGTGLMLVPLPLTAPAAHWSASFDRLDYTADRMRGINVVGLGYGLSPNVEGYVRLTSEQLGTTSSLNAYGFGFKAAVPLDLSVVEAGGAWFETVVSEERRESPFFPPEATRGGITLSAGGPEFRAILIAGANAIDGDAAALSGAGITWAPWRSLRAGVEALSGYAGPGSLHALADLTVVVIPNAALTFRGGRVENGDAASWLIAAGLCVTTAAFDFRPVAAQAGVRQEFKLPSLDELRKEGEEKQ